MSLLAALSCHIWHLQVTFSCFYVCYLGGGLRLQISFLIPRSELGYVYYLYIVYDNWSIMNSLLYWYILLSNRKPAAPLYIKMWPTAAGKAATLRPTEPASVTLKGSCVSSYSIKSSKRVSAMKIHLTIHTYDLLPASSPD